uniref:Uncharacterized protein n=1 Tax=Vespula pensylvanica TaxID=30213 RepID=A0A834NQI8_VESPE|nr:hypothetical protein H0235_012306 [Vespula pensylvanica]
MVIFIEQQRYLVIVTIDTMQDSETARRGLACSLKAIHYLSQLAYVNSTEMDKFWKSFEICSHSLSSTGVLFDSSIPRIIPIQILPCGDYKILRATSSAKLDFKNCTLIPEVT